MSGIVGIYNLDGSPVDSTLLARINDVTSDRGPDGSGYWIQGSVGLAHRMLHTTPESIRERQPLADEESNLCLTFDGRVDNRDELRAQLLAEGVRLRDDTDAELILRAYECWGIESPRRIIGDFAYAIWDKRNRQFFCARDPVGNKQFYYHISKTRFLCCSELRQLLEDPCTPRNPNEGMVAEYLAVAITDYEETLYRDIFRLPLGHSLIVRTDGIKKQKYWDIDPGREIKHRSDIEYAEQFFEIVKEAVRCRLRSQAPVGAYLSGGVDSTTVVGTIKTLKAEGLATAEDVSTFSMIFPTVASCDESEYVKEAVDNLGVRNYSVCPTLAPAGWYLQQASRYGDFPDYPNGTIQESVLALARKQGIRVMLTGHGGDEWFTGSGLDLRESLKSFRFCALWDQLRREMKRNGRSAISIIRQIVSDLLPGPMTRAIRRLKPRGNEIPVGIDPAFFNRVHLAERIRQTKNWPEFTSRSKQWMYWSLASGSILHGRELEDRLSARYGIEQRHPLCDQRLVEFAFALPESQRQREGSTKWVLRTATKGIIPERIRQRADKADFSHTFPQALEVQGGEDLFRSLESASAGWVVEEQVRARYSQMKTLYAAGDAGYIRHNWPLWMAFGIEMWFSGSSRIVNQH